jgi:hypothetical protein
MRTGQERQDLLMQLNPRPATAIDKAFSTALLLCGSAKYAEEVVLGVIQSLGPDEEAGVAVLVYRAIALSLSRMNEPCLYCIRLNARVESPHKSSVAGSGDMLEVLPGQPTFTAQQV